MTNNNTQINNILAQNNIKCEHCIAPIGTRCESAVSNCPYKEINNNLKSDDLNDTKLE